MVHVTWRNASAHPAFRVRACLYVFTYLSFSFVDPSQATKLCTAQMPKNTLPVESGHNINIKLKPETANPVWRQNYASHSCQSSLCQSNLGQNLGLTPATANPVWRPDRAPHTIDDYSGDYSCDLYMIGCRLLHLVMLEC